MNQNLNTETKLCKHCKSEINKLATICPYCKGKNVVRGKRDKLYLALTVLIVIICIGSLSESLETPPAPAPVQKTQAEIDAWNKTPAGKLCAKHPTWKEDDCEGLVDNKIWVGMHYDMLVYLNGKPDVTNPSNYGNGIRYQYCWTGNSPSCFYDKNDDGIIDSFN